MRRSTCCSTAGAGRRAPRSCARSATSPSRSGSDRAVAPMATAEELLRLGVERLRAAGSESPRLDAELLLGHAIGTDRTVLIAHPEAVVSDGAAARYEEALARRSAGEPVAYIRGVKGFHRLAL